MFIIFLFLSFFVSFFFNDPATTEIYTLSLHDALPIYLDAGQRPGQRPPAQYAVRDRCVRREHGDRKSTRLNSSHPSISYAVFCLKKKKKKKTRKSTTTHQSVLRLY